MTDWDEIRTALHVARLGTVSAAAEALGVHHATVIRHVDALEGRLGARLFQRHARGYAPTEAGRDLLRVAQEAEDRFAQLQQRVRGQGDGTSGTLAGELAVTSLAPLSRAMTPVLAEFQERHPAVMLRYLTGRRLFRLEAGEAHVAIRAGTAPEQPDNVVRPLVPMSFALVASRGYLDRNGPVEPADLARHRFVGHDESETRAPFNAWIAELSSPERITFRVSDDGGTLDAVTAGAGLGFLSQFETRGRDDLVEVLPSREAWAGPLWIVTHVDLHRTPKVQAFLALLRERAADWG